MHLRRLLRTALLAGCTLIALQPGQVRGQGEESRIQSSQKELERVRSRLQALSHRLEAQRTEKDSLGMELEAAEKKVSEALEALRRLRRALQTQAEQIAATQAQRAAAQARLADQQQALALQLRAAYVMGTRSRARLLLGAETGRLGRLMLYADRVNQARAQRIEAVLGQIDAIAGLEAQLAEERDRLQTLEAEQAAALSRLEASRDRRRAMIARLDQRLASGAQQLRQLQGEEQQLQKLLESLRDALSDIPVDLGRSDRPFAQQRGKLPWPLRGEVLAEFGAPKAGGRLSWNGRWIAAREGAPVRAVARGRVAHVGWLHRYGLLVILEHDGGYYSLYGHNASVSRSAGEWVEAGGVIASAGDTGGHERTGVYLEIRKGSTALDPRSWLSK